MKKNYFNSTTTCLPNFLRNFNCRLYVLLAIFVLGASGGLWAQSYHTVTFTGNSSDFGSEPVNTGGNGVTYYMTYDASNIYIGAFRGSPYFGAGDNLAIYFDTDPNATPTSGTGTNAGYLYSSVTGTLPFTANYGAHIQTGYYEVKGWSSGTTWNTLSSETGNNNLTVNNSGTSALEIAIPLTELGSPKSLYVTMWVGYSGGGGGTYSAPNNSTLGGTNPTVSFYFGGFGVTSAGFSPMNVTNYPITDSIVNAAPVSGAVYGYVSNSSGTNTAGGNFTIAGGGSINVSGGTFSPGSNTVTMNAGSTVNYTGGTFTNTGSTYNFLGAGYTIGSSAITFNNVTINAGTLTLTEVPTINGIFQINGGNVSAGPNYGGSSTLTYNVANYTAFNEWTPNATSGAGIPFNVNIGNGTNSAVNFGSSANYYYLGGTMTIASGSSFTQSSNGSSAGLKFGGGLTNNGTYTDNGRGTWFVGGSATTGVFQSSSALTFNYLIHDGAGTLQLGSSNLTIAANSNALQFLSTGGMDMNGHTLTFNSGAGIQLQNSGQSITSSSGTGIISESGTLNIPSSGTGTLTTGVAVNIVTAGELNIANSSALTINGVLQFNSGSPGGYVNANPPVYGTGSTLIYNNGGLYGVGTEWKVNTTSGAGVPYNVQAGNGASGSGLQFTTSGTYTMLGSMSIGSGYTLTLDNGNLNVGGNFTNSGTFNNSSKTVTLNGGGTQTIGGTSSSTFYNLTIANTLGGVTISQPTTVSNTLTLTSGVVTTSASNTLSVTNPVTTAVAGSSSSYINGPLNITIPMLSGSSNVYNFPVGAGGNYFPLSITSITTSAASVLQVQAFNSAPTGTADGSTLTSLSASNEYWETKVISGGTITAASISITQPSAVAPNNAIGTNPTNSGNWSSIAGSPITSPTNSIINSSSVSLSANSGINYFTMAEAPLPTVTSITYNSPSGVSGEVSPGVYYGQTVTLNGTNFTNVTQVAIGSTVIPLSSFIPANTYTSTTIELQLPSPASGNIVVTSSTLGAGPAFIPTYLGYITNNASSADWNLTTTWAGMAIPPSGATTTVNTTVTIGNETLTPATVTITSAGSLAVGNASASLTATTITNNGTFTFSAAGSATATTFINGGTLSWTAAGTLNIASGGTLTNNGTFTRGSGTVTFTGAASFINGSNAITFNNLTYSMNAATALNIPSSGTIPTIDGTLLVEGGHISSAPYYGPSSTLAYNEAAYSINNFEWVPGNTSSSQIGVPQNVLIGDGINTAATFTGTSGSYYLLGNFTVSSGSSVMLGSCCYDLFFGGNFSNQGTYNDNSRATEYNGTGTGTLTSSTPLTLNYLVINNTGNLQLATGTAAITIGGNSNSLQFLSTGELDLNGNTLAFNSGAGIELNGGASNIISSAGTGTLTFSGTLNIPSSGTGTLTTSAAVNITVSGVLTTSTAGALTVNGAMTSSNELNNTNATGLNINGTLQINGGAYVNANPPVYGSSSTLIYNQLTGYGNNDEWTGGATTTVAAGAGIPANVIVQGSGTYSVDLAGARGVPGSVTTNVGNTLSLAGDLYIGGNLTVNGPLVTNSKAVWMVEGNAQSINSTNYPNVTFDYLLIDKTANAVTLNIPIQVNQILTMSSGNINSTTSNTVNILNTGTGGIASGSTSSYINGPVNWTLPASLSASASIYKFPVGNGGVYLPLSITTITTGGTGPVIQVQATDMGSGGSYNTNTLASISTTEYWEISQQSGNYTSASVSLTRQAALGSLNAIGWNSTAANGTYAYEAGTVSGTSINNSNVVGAGYLVMAQELPAPTINSVTVGTPLNGQGANTGYIGQTVTISGNNFSSNDNVTFNGTAPLNVVITPPSTITAIVNIGTSITTGTVVVTDPATTLQGSAAFTNLGYISTASSDWNTNTTWLNGGSGATNFTGTSAIPVANSTVTIVNTVGVSGTVTNAPNVVTVTSAGDLSFGGGTVTVNTTLTNNGTVDMTGGGTLTMASGGTLTNNSTFTGGAGTVSFTAAGTINGSTAATLYNLTIGTGAVTLTKVPTVNGTLQINSSTGSVVGYPNYGSSSTVVYNANFTRGNEWSSQASTAPGYVIVQNSSLLHTGAPALTLNIGHDLTLGNGTGSGSLNMDNSGEPIVVGGNINIGGSSGTSTLTLSSANGGDIKLGGNWSLNANGSFAPSTRSVFFTGGNAQTITGATTFDYINMDKTGNSNLTLNNNISVNHTIFLTDAGTGGLIITGSNTVEMQTGASTSGASATSHIDGNESYAFTSGSLSFTYDIGDASVQAGVNVTYSSISTGGTLTAYTTDGDHPQIGTSGIYAPHSVMRYHTLSNSGIVGGSYTATFYFATSDIGSGSNTADFVVMEYVSPNWNSTTTGTRGSNSTQATGLTTYGDFQIGDLAPQGSLTGSSVCAGSTGQLTWTATAGTGPFTVVYSDGTNHSQGGVVSGTPFNIYSGPASTTNYTLVSVTDAIGDVTTSGFTGNMATITVIALTPASVSITPYPSGAICQGQTISYVATPTYGGSSPTYNFTVNGTSVQSGTSNSLTSNTINNGNTIICYMTSDAVCPSPTTSTSNTITQTVYPVPAVYNVTGGGNFCPGGSVAVGLSNSQTGVNYELENGATGVVGPIAGNTGNTISFGNISTGATYTVVATNATTGCVSNMSGSAVVTVNPQAATPGLTASATTVCAGDPVTFTASGGSQYGFYVNDTLYSTISDTSTFTISNLNNNDQVTATSFSPITFDGNIVESAWGSPIATSTGGPYDNGGTFFGGGPGFGAGYEINAFYAISDANNINMAIAGNIQNNNHILLFIQTQSSGGYNNGSFGRNSSPVGAITDFNSGTTFTPGFLPNYVLAIGTNSGNTDYFFDLYTLSAGGGPDVYLGDIAVGSNHGAVLGANPANGTQTQGFEMAIPKTLLNYTGGTISVFAMLSSDGGYLSNQFLTHAGAGAANYGSGAINFTTSPGSFAIPALNTDDNCSATSSPITMTIGSNLTPTISISASPGNTICTGTTVNFTSSIANGGPTPSYQWYKGTYPTGTVVGTNSTYSSNSLNNGDQIWCVLTSDASCVSTTTATSNTITMSVSSTLTPSFNISVSPSSTACAGTNVTFSPTNLTNQGSSPTYQWYDGVNLVATTTDYTSNSINNGDVITCSMTSNAACASPTTVSSTNSITMNIEPTPSVYSMTGGGSYCSGTSGVAIGLANSQTGINYQLYSGASVVGSDVPGNTGSAITFGNQTTNGTDYNVIATNATTGCMAAMTGTESVYTNITPATPTILASENPICQGTPVTISAIDGSLFQFFVNGNSQGAESTTNNFTSSSFNNGDIASVTSYSSIVYDGNITESIWGSPLATSVGGPSPGFGTGDEINAVYANGDGAHVNLAIAGNIQTGNRILLFIQSQSSGGFNVANFSETNAPPGLNNFNQGTTFPTGFYPNYCLVIGANGSSDNYFDLFTLASTSSAGTDAYLGGRSIHYYGVQAGGNPAPGSETQGFEISLPNSLLNYTAGNNIQVMGMVISEAGYLSNEFLTHADVSSSNFGSGAVYFPGSVTNPTQITIPAAPLDNTCTASASLTMSVSPQPSSGTLTPAPAVGSYCAGTELSATATAGSGAPAGTFTDVLQYTTNGGSSWTSYTSGSSLNTSSFTSVTPLEIETYRTSTVAGCTSSTPTTVTWTINPLPVIYNVTGGACIPAAVGLSGSQNGSNYQYQLYVNNTPIGSPLTGNGGPLTFGDQVDSGIYTVIATNTATSCTQTMNGVATVDFCTSTWVGGVDTNWSTQDNWNPAAVPNNCYVNVVIPAGTLYSPHVNANSSNVYVRNMNISSGVTLTLSGENLNVCGQWTGGSGSNAAVIGSGTVYINGTSGAQTISGNTQFSVLQINNSNGVSLNRSSTVAISSGLQLAQGNLNVSIATLHLLSTSSNTNSYIDDFSDGFTGTLTGSIIADRYVPVAGSNQHFVSSPVDTPEFIQLPAWGPDGSYVVPTADCDETQSAYGSPYGGVFQYNDGHMGPNQCMLGNWEIRSVGNTQNGLGYSVYLQGDTVLSLTGTANTGDISIGGLNNSGYPSVSTLQGEPIASGWNLVGNPYPSALNMTTARSGFGNQIQLWQTDGPFAGSWQAALITENGLQLANLQYIEIAPFQAFMVQVSGGAGQYSYNFYQGERTRTTDVPFYRASVPSTLVLDLDYNGSQDVTTVAFNSSATYGFDPQFDADKQDGSAGRPTLYSYFPGQGKWYSINTVPALTQTAAIPVGLRPEANTTMTIAAQNIESFDPTTYIYLEDKKTGGAWTNLRNGMYTFSTTTTDSQQRFVLHFTPPAIILTTDATCETLGMINVQQPGTANWNYTITDANNTTIASGILNAGAPVNISANAGVYTLTLTDNNGYTVVKNLEIGGTQEVSAAFTASTNNAQVEQNITFNGGTDNTSTYNWDFGDGTTARGAQATHSYQSEGVYMVKLTVNGGTGCVSTSSQTITVTTRAVTGINNVAGNDLSIWSYENTVFVDFSKVSNVDAEVQLYNVLGQVLSDERFGKSSLYSKDLTNLEAAYIIVKVINNDQITTKNVFIANVNK